MGIYANQKFMWGVLSFLVSPRVVSEFCNGQKFTSIVLSSINEVPEVYFDPEVHSFTLSVSVRVEGCAHVLFDACCLAHSFCKVSSESWVSV